MKTANDHGVCGRKGATQVKAKNPWKTVDEAAQVSRKKPSTRTVVAKVAIRTILVRFGVVSPPAVRPKPLRNEAGRKLGLLMKVNEATPTHKSRVLEEVVGVQVADHQSEALPRDRVGASPRNEAEAIVEALRKRLLTRAAGEAATRKVLVRIGVAVPAAAHRNRGPRTVVDVIAPVS